MVKYCVVLIMILFSILLSSFVIAQHEATETVKIEMSLNGETFSKDYMYKYIILDKKEVVMEEQTFVDKGFIYINVPKGYYGVELLIDDPNTEGYDYFGKTGGFFPLEVDEHLKIPLFEVGSLKINIQDSKGRFVSDALIRIDCSKKYGSHGYYNSDAFGVVDIENLPAGNCVIRAAYDDLIAKESVIVSKGETHTLSIELEGSIKKSSYWYVWLIVVLVFVAIASYIVSKNNNSVKESVEVGVKSDKEDIIKVLNKKEKLVVNFMLEKKEEHSGKNEFYVSQADIVYGAGIPKTSLMRVLSSLEDKKIILVEKIGKLKKISFSPWFESK